MSNKKKTNKINFVKPDDEDTTEKTTEEKPVKEKIRRKYGLTENAKILIE